MSARRAAEPIRSVSLSLGKFEQARPTTPGIDVSSLSDLPVRYGRDEFTGPQRPEFSILLLVSGGQATHMLDFTPYRLRAGDLLWIRRGQVQEWGPLDDISGQVISFDSHVLPADVWSHVDSAAWARSYWPGVLATSPEVSSGAAFISAVAAGQLGATAPRATALAHAIAALLISLTLTSSSPEADGETSASARDFRRFMSTVDTQINAAPNVQTVARALAISPKTVDRVARAHTGRSAKRIIDDRVILEAKRLLVHTTSPVGTIARQLGYTDTGNFSRYFRRVEGLSPMQFRDRHLEV